MYFLTIQIGDSVIVERRPYGDYSDAIAACAEHYEPRFPGSVLKFSCEVIGKKFMRSYASLTRLEDLGEDVDRSAGQGFKAVKDGNAFVYPKTCTFLIESELGARETDQFRDVDAKEDAEEAGRLH